MVKSRKHIVMAMVVCILLGFASSGWTAEGTGKVNINSASVEEMSQLRGIGPAIAQWLVYYRDANGNFRSVEDIVNVRGIGVKTFENIKGGITVGH